VIPPSQSGAELPAGQSVSLTEVAGVLWARRNWVLITTVVVTGLAVAYAFFSTPVYRAAVLVQPVTDRSASSMISDLMGQAGGLASLVGLSGLGEGEQNIAVPLLTSDQFLERFIVEEHLMPRLFASRWDEKRQQWRNPRKAPTIARGIKQLQRKVIDVREDRRRKLVTITVEWRDRAEAAKWANILVKRVNEDTRTRAIEEARRSKIYLDRELAKTTIVELQRAINRLTEAQIKTEMMAQVRDDFSLRVIDPARVPDADDFVRPRRLLLIAGGFVFGIALGMFLALAWHTLQRARRAANPEARRDV
jgi:uncharacterized protein involved in exopolysaccharide biosynthesis